MQEKRRRQEADRGSEGNGSGGEVDPAAFRRGAPRANHRTRRRRGSSTSTKPSRRPPLPLRCAQERPRLRSSAAKKASREESRLSTAGALEITREILHLGRGHQLPTRDTTHLVTFEHDGLQVCPGSVDCSSVPGRAGTNDHQVLHSLARICNNQQPPSSSRFALPPLPSSPLLLRQLPDQMRLSEHPIVYCTSNSQLRTTQSEIRDRGSSRGGREANLRKATRRGSPRRPRLRRGRRRRAAPWTHGRWGEAGKRRGARPGGSGRRAARTGVRRPPRRE